MPDNKKSFWHGFLNSALGAALNGAASAQNSGANLKTTGVAAGATALTGLLAFLLTHPLGQAPEVQQAVATSVPPAANPTGPSGNEPS